MSKLVIDIQSILDKNGSYFNYEIDKNIDLFTQQEPYLKIKLESGQVKFENIEKGILAQGRVASKIDQECDRCTKLFHRSELLDFKEVFFFKRKLDEDIDEEFYILKNHLIDLGDYLIQFIRLNTPIKVLCQPSCLGLCTICGSDLNIKKCDCHREKIDPRFNKLKKMIDKN